MLLTVENLTKSFGDQRVINDVSFDIVNNKVLGFLGPNGAGKSTTMKIITGFIQPDKGRVMVQGMDVAKHGYEIKRMIGYLPEHNPQYLDMYVLESLYFTANIYQLVEPGRRIKEVIDRVGLGEERNKKIKQLSKGYRQRLGLAQAILHEPEILILDEPTAGLDPNQLQEIRGFIRELGRDKVVILSTHIMQEVEAVCEEVIFMNKGKLAGNYVMSELPNMFADKSLEQVFASLTQ